MTTSGTTRRWLFALAVVLHVAVGLFFYGLAAGLFIPGPDVYWMGAVWFVLLGAVVALRGRPSLCLAIPFVAVAVFFVASILGVRYLGWEG